MQYLKNPSLPFIAAKADRKGNLFADQEFKYERDPFRPEWSNLLRMLVSPNPQRQEKKADDFRPPVSPDAAYLTDKSQDWIVWLGHACFLIQLNGVRILIDPQLRDMPFVPRRVSPPFGPEDITDVDFLLLSHDHRDHVDEKSIKRFLSSTTVTKILCPLGLTNVIQGWVDTADKQRGGPATVIEEAAWYQIFGTERTGVRITYLPSRHWCRRGLLDFNQVLWGSFMIERIGEPAGNGLNTIYFGGDSAKTAYWKEIGTLYPNIDVAMLGIGAYAPDYMMEENHANPAEAFQGFKDLGARLWWPMHYGTYDLSNEPAGEPIRWARRLVEENGMGERLIGETINLPFRGERPG
ncbi:MBL fold metallo-hydrolase [Neolewinella antarctica]|uniref:L-ascorbate metabolism protein UlaG (Beta-lactamase superfamily) n=1 Tax=Neolewinella antarctica TaxID=442734 RepID=A0ABX0X9D1_9BACT|nr:MBL fold metallo-hydrolase [Neolewinella antarctica]NJC25564.1 L-ascorbate metabolism protein UlaG (beta-lactamase superfamily) [Neolewinella antarctica]